MAEQPKVVLIPVSRSMRIALTTLQHLMIPNVCGVSWSKILPASDLPHNAVLSVCKLSLRAGIDVSQGEQMAARFWAASLEYIRSIPDCTALYWAYIENKPETLIALIQWKAVSAWKSFQSSIGFRLMTGILTTECLNRASSIILPDSVTAGDVIEIAAFQLAATEPMVNFSATWAQFAAGATKTINPQCVVFGGWLERDGPYIFNSLELKALADTQPNVFLAFLFYKHRPVTIGTLPSSLQENISLLSRYTTDHGILTSPVHRELLEQPINDSSILSQPISCRSISELLSIHPPRIYRQENGFWKSQDRIHGQSLEDQRVGKRLFPGPRGIFTAMGDLNQYSLPQVSRLQPPSIHDVILLHSVKSPETSFQEFFDLQNFCGAWKSARNLGAQLLKSDSQWALMLSFADSKSRTRQLPQILSDLQSFEIVDCYTMANPANLNELHLSLADFGAHRLKELVTFYVRRGGADQSLFESAYSNFIDSMKLYAPNPPNTACVPYGGGWDSGLRKRSGVDVLRFNAVITWYSLEGMEEWYSDFANGAMQSYERLGHIIDRLQLVTVDIESLLFRPL